VKEFAADARRGRVLAIVLTFNAPDNVAVCVSALSAQTYSPAGVLVVENPSHRPIDGATLQGLSRVPVEILRLPTNVGPAGGYAAGLDAASRQDFETVWVMDDDVVPEPTCLERLAATLEENARKAVVAPVSFDAVTGEDSSTWGWCGVLTSVRLIEAIGLPMTELFYGLEDQNYLMDRAPLAGYRLVREPSAVVRLGRRPGLQRPAWHYYYLARNATYLYLYHRRHLPLFARVKMLLVFHGRVVRTIFRYHAERRIQRIVMYGRGLFDGVFARLGRRVAPTGDHRPTVNHPAE
jgi:rhamnopyranosyl-N-acetylglucosaminyl-diphospho-decaprenol beta-1,3/1,4-galactofuranosyltransferase